MILRRPHLTLTTSKLSLPNPTTRNLQHSIPIRPVPKPTPFIPDHTAFLSAIGRGLSAHAAKIPSWTALFTLSSNQLKDLGIEPARSRRYLLDWREKFRNGEFGVGGDCAHVEDGVAELRVVDAPVGKHPVPGMNPRSALGTATKDAKTRRMVVNVPKKVEGSPVVGKRMTGVKGVVLKGSNMIKGSYVEPIKGSGGLQARIRMQEGIWEVKRGHKVDGGERRRAQVRAKRRAEENKENKR